MTDLWIAPELIFDGDALMANKAMLVRSGRIVEVDDASADTIKIAGVICPGFVDLQVNGGGGVLFNTTPTRAGIATIADAHRSFGTVAVLPTVITDHVDVMDQAADAVIAAKDDRGIVGIHIEGPHISKTRRGTHASEFVRPLDERTLSTVKRLSDAQVSVMITVAPEAVTLKQIQQLVTMGAVVSLGHTDATSDQVKGAFAAGASCATHLFNAMSPMIGRAPGAVGAIINSDCYSGIICDGHHVADEMVGLAIRARPVADRMFLVSDSMATVGGPDHFDLYGRRVGLTDGRLLNAEGSLAGAHVTQHEGVRRLVRNVGIAPETALRMTITTPAECIGRPELGQLRGRDADDIILLSSDFATCASLTSKLHELALVNAS